MLANSPPRLHVTVNLPPVISFSSVEEPQLEVRMTLEYLQPVIIVLKRIRLWPLHLHSVLFLHNVSSRQQDYPPCVDAQLRHPSCHPPMPPLDAEHKEIFVGLKPRQTSVVTVSFRLYKEPYYYGQMKGRGIESYKMLFPTGMQSLHTGEVYEIGIQGGCTEEYVLGDMDDIVGDEGKLVEWTPAGGLVQMQAPCYIPAFRSTHIFDCHMTWI
ncbi:hypothetical protein N7G274_007572 [Stereocaulon virgatum]|uniref:Uncharacterized protein n=1 Tax=Stereocaulon virgatum TaxID=373712 RepID=A0ABR4A8P9_9LECA